VTKAVLPDTLGSTVVDYGDRIAALEAALATSGAFPTGSIMLWPTTSPPAGWVLCDGSVYTKVNEAALYDVLGQTYGGVAGTSCAVPDCRGRGPVGKAASGTFSSVGGTGGAASSTISQSNLPSLTWPNTLAISPNPHAHDLHFHGSSNFSAGGWNLADVTGGDGQGAGTISTSLSLTGGVTSGGSGTALATLDPYIVLVYIIKL
jgi:microcystin-dependent protein